MTTYQLPSYRRWRLAAALVCLLGVLACEDDQAPKPLPAGITVVSGDNQYTRKGTQLEEPVAVRVTLESGNPAEGVEVRFQVIEGGGHLSKTTATTNGSGRASVLWTMGTATGANRMRITVADNTDLSATATATSSEYYCIEEDPAFSQKFTPAHNLMMLTRQSDRTSGLAGVLRFSLTLPTFSTNTVATYPEGTFINVVRDLAFSANGDLFIAFNNEVMKVSPNGDSAHFATLDPAIEVEPGAELAMTPNGVLVGCDAKGPFYVTCRDSLYRFENAVYSGINDGARDLANNDALACDPNTGDVYFIYLADRDLLKISFDGTTAGTPAKVADLSQDESDGANGMVVDADDGSVYILVESAGMKAIRKVDTTGGVVSTAYDFFDRPGGSAGIQSDLAIDRDPIRYLYTLDTLNNTILRLAIFSGQLSEFTSDGDPYDASDQVSGERVGLDVIR